MTKYIEGIYVKQTKGQIGTGITTKEVVYRNFFALLPTGGAWYNMHHLTDKLQPTGLVEPCQETELTGLIYVAKADPFFQKIKDKLPQNTNLPKPKTLADVPAEEEAKPEKKSGWKPYVQESKGDWWSQASKGSHLLKKN